MLLSNAFKASTWIVSKQDYQVEIAWPVSTHVYENIFICMTLKRKTSWAATWKNCIAWVKLERLNWKMLNSNNILIILPIKKINFHWKFLSYIVCSYSRTIINKDVKIQVTYVSHPHSYYGKGSILLETWNQICKGLYNVKVLLVLFMFTATLWSLKWGDILMGHSKDTGTRIKRSRTLTNPLKKFERINIGTSDLSTEVWTYLKCIRQCFLISSDTALAMVPYLVPCFKRRDMESRFVKP